MSKRNFNGAYKDEFLNRVAFPMGGIGAGMICLEGTGAFSHVSLRHKPDVFNEPYLYAALCLKGVDAGANVARVLEGPVPSWKLFGTAGAGNGLHTRTYGLPRFASATFRARFPFGTVKLRDPRLPVEVQITGWSPFVPGDADSASLPVAELEYRIRNRGTTPLEAVFSFNAQNPILAGKQPHGISQAADGVIFEQKGSDEAPWDSGQFYMGTDAPGAVFNSAWFRGGWFDGATMAWRDIVEGRCVSRPPVMEGDPSRGASFSVPLSLAPGAATTVRVLLAWHVPFSNIRVGFGKQDVCTAETSSGTVVAPRKETYVPWYAGRFASVADVVAHWRREGARLRRESQRFSRCLYDTTLPPEAMEAITANLTILKSPTVLRQTDGRLWGWEGCCDGGGCCHGSCTHVWNYAQALPHLFPALERSLRQTEFGECQAENGHQNFRAPLPIYPTDHKFHAASDGQLGGIMKVYREWRVSGDTEWLRGLWPYVKASLNYCIETWDPDHKGCLEEPHHNTYDIEFWGPDGMCTSFYLGALVAAVAMGHALGDPVPLFGDLAVKARTRLEGDLYDGEYFIQKVQWEGLKAKSPVGMQSMLGAYSTEAVELLKREGPKYQYGSGCLSDGVLGAWMAEMCGLGGVLDADKVRSHLKAVHRHNLKTDLSTHANPQRPSFAAGKEGGLLLCSWPKGGNLSLPFVYSEEVWTGIEYQAASHMIRMGLVEEGLEVVRVARKRYDGRVRNPFNEYECGHWYARAMSSYGLLQAWGGARYDAVDQVLYLAPAVAGDYRVFLCTATGYGTAGVRDGQPFLEVVRGSIPVQRMEYKPAAGR